MFQDVSFGDICSFTQCATCMNEHNNSQLYWPIFISQMRRDPSMYPTTRSSSLIMIMSFISKLYTKTLRGRTVLNICRSSWNSDMHSSVMYPYQALCRPISSIISPNVLITGIISTNIFVLNPISTNVSIYEAYMKPIYKA